MKKQIASFSLALVCWGAVSTTQAQSFYPLVDTTLYPGGGYTEITVGNAQNSITGAFTSSTPDAVLGLSYLPTGVFANINGAAFFNQKSGDSLDIQFSSAITAFQINWAADQTSGLSVMDLSAFLNGDSAGTATSTASNPLHYDEGAMVYENSGGFDSLVIGLDPTVGAGASTGLWAIGTDVANTGNFGNVTAVPEPSTLALSSMGGLGTLLLFRRRKLA
jgi:hypothetical protein